MIEGTASMLDISPIRKIIHLKHGVFISERNNNKKKKKCRVAMDISVLRVKKDLF